MSRHFTGFMDFSDSMVSLDSINMRTRIKNKKTTLSHKSKCGINMLENFFNAGLPKG